MSTGKKTRRSGRGLRPGSAAARTPRPGRMKLELVAMEYKDLSEHVRHYNTIQVAMWTVYFAITAGLLKLAIDLDLEEGRGNLVDTLKYAGILTTGVFWIRGFIYYNRQASFERRLNELECTWSFRNYRGYVKAAHRRLRIGRAIAFLLFLGIMGFWVISILRPSVVGF